MEIICYKEKLAYLHTLELQVNMLVPNGSSIHERANVLMILQLVQKCCVKQNMWCQDCLDSVDTACERTLALLYKSAA